MPLYTVSTKTPIPAPVKQQLAKLIMDVHCGITGAPETFVNVVYSEGVPMSDDMAYHILATVRKGRTKDMNNELKNEMCRQIVKLLNTSPQLLKLSIYEMPAAWVMEGGNILPEPGEEDQCGWLQNAQH